MFDTRGRDSENYHKNLLDALENNKKKYDKQLYTDWILKVYDKCANECMPPPSREDEQPGVLKMFEKRCATNCIRKYDKAYKLYTNVEDTIFSSYMETTEIDPE